MIYSDKRLNHIFITSDVSTRFKSQHNETLQNSEPNSILDDLEFPPMMGERNGGIQHRKMAMDRQMSGGSSDASNFLMNSKLKRNKQLVVQG